MEAYLRWETRGFPGEARAFALSLSSRSKGTEAALLLSLEHSTRVRTNDYLLHRRTSQGRQGGRLTACYWVRYRAARHPTNDIVLLSGRLAGGGAPSQWDCVAIGQGVRRRDAQPLGLHIGPILSECSPPPP